MTPYEINVLLYYYSRVDDHEDIHRQPPIWEPTIEALMADGLLQCAGDGERAYKLTERGEAYIDALQRVPPPEQRWVMLPEAFRS